MTPSRREFVRVSAALGGALGLGAAGRPLLGRERAAGARRSTRDRSEGPSSSTARAPLRLLVLGGTGFIGPHQIRYAMERGHTITIFNRGRTNPGLFPEVEKLRGDRDGDLESLKGHEWDVVIDNSGFYPRHVRDSARLLEGSVGRYLFVSSISAYGGSLEAGQDEYEAPLATMEDPTDESDPPYGRTYGPRKVLCENEVREAFGDDRAVIVRPGLITGPGDPTDRIRHWIARVERGGEILVPGAHDDPVQLIDARDLTAWMIRLLERGDAGLFNGVGPEAPLSIAEMVYGIRAVSSSNVSFTWVDEPFLVEHRAAGRYSPWTPAQGRAFMQVTHARALATGLTFLPLATTAFDMLEEYRAATDERREAGFGRRGGLPWDREAELLADWHARQR